MAIPPNCPTVDIEDDRTGLSVDTLRRALADNLFYIQGKWPKVASRNDFYLALAYTVRDRMMQRWLNSTRTYLKPEVRVVAYLSAEFLLGPHLGRNLLNLGITEPVKQAIAESGLNFDELAAQEEEPGLGNGGLGRLAACYMESLASLQIPAIGYGIRYEFGIFDQDIRDGWQVEITDKWLQYGNPWEIPHPESAVTVGFGGYTEGYTDSDGRYRKRWIPAKQVKGIPHDTPIPGYSVNTINTLRLWKAEAVESFNFQSFNVGDYYGAVNSKVTSENISKVLYPNDEQIEGKQLRLEQQFFFVSCALQDMIRIHLASGRQLEHFHEKFAAQLNDTHPAVGVAELMRLLLDQHGIEWDKAWHITQHTFAFTNHTLLPEALEKWPISLFGGLLPRHLEIIFEINQRFMDQVRVQYLNDPAKLASLSLIDESGERYVRMANLASLGSYAINGVAALHSELVKQTILKDFHELFPSKIRNVTNGVTPRRWLALSNPRLAALYTEKLGDGWLQDMDQLRSLEGYADDPGFRQYWRQIKRDIKQNLATYIHSRTGIAVSPDSLFDIQVKRIHEYKRQHLNVLHIITLYERLKQNPNLDITPRTFIFGGKAAPGYHMAKLMIKFITAVGDVVNNDSAIGDRLKVVFLPDYNVTFGQRVYPAADLSEQISTAGKEASGTGNMKFSMNGALTIGTLDGANVEIRQQVGDENFFLFGLTTDEVTALKASGYNPWDYYTSNPQLKEVIDLVNCGFFAQGNPELFKPLTDNLLHSDPYLLLADYQAYINAQDQVGTAYQDQENWSRMSILNAVRMGKFSSDRSIRDYCNDIWKVSPVPVELLEYDQSQAGLKV
ncbi:glycogen/starch/alpha-glucan phosphorylase [Nodosilinea sp. LEGE 07298]|uniref:glycogen/starch/alpha-glucan phosphorylase n=1 Tax=Nodosilinea sp. LEGE 07298 TaxID=2777970 RepID=UPI0018828745|nr:glycogen/starch/alpha-glucan phosphorylase [Nodosilinea sp. LEGE 07298]MBE9110359.1 glycogen/starch/alpha-glucan phosphorylase [Nodosilinea sp. LEGE 07298]